MVKYQRAINTVSSSPLLSPTRGVLRGQPQCLILRASRQRQPINDIAILQSRYRTSFYDIYFLKYHRKFMPTCRSPHKSATSRLFVIYESDTMAIHYGKMSYLAAFATRSTSATSLCLLSAAISPFSACAHAGPPHAKQALFSQTATIDDFHDTGCFREFSPRSLLF